MAVKRKDKELNHNTPTKTKRIRQEKPSDFSDDEDLSDIEEGEMFNGIRIPAELPPIMSAEKNQGPRMIIRDIVANNFKSYYGEVTIGQFHKSLTSIVGANGSGKSNVIDSLLFVFGYRSTKIRSKKVSVLLHKSDKHKDVHQCSVTVNFVHIIDDDTKNTGFVVVPGSEIKITRTAFKDNTSFYTLNNKRVKFKDVAAILMKNGIDLIHNRFLILQGEVEQIAMMKPKAENEHSTGMLEYLEDVIGTARYKKPIAKLEDKIKEISLEKNEKLTRLKFVTKEREELIEPVEAVIRTLKLENQKTQLYNKNYQLKMYHINMEVKKETENKNKINDELKSIETELETIFESTKNKEGILRKLNEKLKLDLKEKDKLDKECKNFQLNSEQFKNEITQINSQIKKYENSIKQEQNKINKAKDVPIAKEAERKHLQSQLAPLEEECIKLEANYSKINSSGFEKSKKFREEKDLLAPDELKLQKIMGIKQNQFQSLKTEFEVLLDTEKSEKGKLNVLEEQIKNGSEEFQENMKKKEKAEAEIVVCKNTIKDLERNIEKLKKDEEQMKTSLQNIQQSLTEKRSTYAETTERSRPIQYILNLKDKGAIRGLLGRCGDYGQVESKFDVPACTACGSTDQIVVETTEAAHACIQQLRANNIGRLTFSILPQVQKLKFRADANNNYPENAKRIFDFIQILDQRFRLTFYSGLYDTLLAENLEQARRIAFGTQTRYRVVTYKGELIDQSGLMSGGGRPIKGKIGPQETKSKYAGGNTSQVSQTEVERLDKVAKDLEIKLRETQSNIYDFQGSIEHNHRQIEELNMRVRQFLSRINSWKEKENQLKNLIENQKLVIVEKKTDPIAVANKEAEIKNAEKELEQAKDKYNEIKSKVDDLKKKIEEITEGEPREAKRLLDEATNKLEKTRSGINQINVDIQASERKIKKSESQIENLKDDINNCHGKIKTLEEKLENILALEPAVREKADKFKVDIEEQKKYIEDMKKEDDDCRHKSNDLRKNKIILLQKLDEIESKLVKSVDQCYHYKVKLSKLKLHIIPKLDYSTRDPVMESYQNHVSLTEVSQDEQNENDDSNKNDKAMQVDNDSNKDDDDSDINDKELIQYTDEQLMDIEKTFDFNIKIIDEDINKEKPNFGILEEFKKRTRQYNERADDVAAVLKLYNEYNDMVNLVRHRRRDEFMVSFKKITIKLKEMYQMITLGGDAELELVDSLDPFSEGVNFSVRPPKKTWKVISNLSGGEKTLSSLALVFALHYYKPSPLYVMDEIDAALDFKNVSIIGHYIKERTKNSQFIIISLRSNMFEKSNLLVGIFKTNDCTKTTSIDTDHYAKILAGALANSRK